MTCEHKPHRTNNVQCLAYICITHFNLSNKLCCVDEGSRVPSESRFRTAFCKNSFCICNNRLSKYNNNAPPKMTRGNRPTFLLYIAGVLSFVVRIE